MKIDLFPANAFVRWPNEFEVFSGERFENIITTRPPVHAARRWIVAALAMLSAVAMTACGSGGDGGEGGNPSRADDTAEGWLYIHEPASTGAYKTDQTTALLSGSSFNFTLNNKCLPEDGWIPERFRITWANAATGGGGRAKAIAYCYYNGLNTDWEIDPDEAPFGIPLAMGTNPITVTADDGAGNVGRDTIIVTRTVDTTPPTIRVIYPDTSFNGFVELEFSELISMETINASTMFLTTGGWYASTGPALRSS